MNNFNPIVHQRVGIVEGRVYEKNRNGEIKNIYWQYNCKKADLEWLSDEVIKINGVKLNVKKKSIIIEDNYRFLFYNITILMAIYVIIAIKN